MSVDFIGVMRTTVSICKSRVVVSVCSRISLGRVVSTSEPTIVLSVVLLAAYIVAVWAMAGKPN